MTDDELSALPLTPDERTVLKMVLDKLGPDWRLHWHVMLAGHPDAPAWANPSYSVRCQHCQAVTWLPADPKHVPEELTSKLTRHQH